MRSRFVVGGMAGLAVLAVALWVLGAVEIAHNTSDDMRRARASSAVLGGVVLALCSDTRKRAAIDAASYDRIARAEVALLGDVVPFSSPTRVASLRAAILARDDRKRKIAAFDCVGAVRSAMHDAASKTDGGA